MTQGEEPSIEIFGPADGENYLEKLCKYLKMYFRCHSDDVPAQFHEILDTGMIKFNPNKHLQIRSMTGQNFRDEIAKTLFI